MHRTARGLRKVSSIRWYSTGGRFVEATSRHYDGTSRVEGFDVTHPVIFKQSFTKIPAIGRWFTSSPTDPQSRDLNLAYLEQHGTSIVPLELTRSTPDAPTFDRFDAPFCLLLSHMSGPDTLTTRLYLAQHALADLPAALQSDLPAPMTLLSQLGRGDMYASSVWMGRPPTRTPLHRDPNPNLFVQLAGQKVVRLMRPEVGRGVYERVRAEVGRQAGRANVRGEEMMEGREMEGLEKAVWEGVEGVDGVEGVEAELGCGDGLYIPLGWWHAVRGVVTGANASVNWWFR